jgi:hypothetical protein
MDMDQVEENTKGVTATPQKPLAGGAGCLWVCCEYERFVDYLSIWDLVSLSQVCRSLRYKREELLGGLVTRLLKPYVSEPLEFRKVMRTQGAVLSGSSVLWLIEGMPETWTPGDLDIYAPRWKSGGIVNFLVNEGYTIISSDKPFPEEYMKLGFLESVTKLRKGGRSIDVMESLSPNALQPITFFYTTLVMNYITSDSIKILYPLLTSSRFGVPHHATAHRREVDWKAKYSSRSFTVCPSHYLPLKFQFSICKGLVRAPNDRMSLSLPFSSPIWDFDTYGDRIARPEASLTWHLIATKSEYDHHIRCTHQLCKVDHYYRNPVDEVGIEVIARAALSLSVPNIIPKLNTKIPCSDKMLTHYDPEYWGFHVPRGIFGKLAESITNEEAQIELHRVDPKNKLL